MNNHPSLNDPQNHGAHKSTRADSTDYNDGANVTDYLGNDDHEGNSAAFNSGSSSDDEVGKVAYGNNLEEDSDDELVDQAGRESFPASDPPGYRSKSADDSEMHEDHKH